MQKEYTIENIEKNIKLIFEKENVDYSLFEKEIQISFSSKENIERNIKSICEKENIDYSLFEKEIQKSFFPNTNHKYFSQATIKGIMLRNYRQDADNLILKYTELIQNTLRNSYKDDMLIAWIDISGFKNGIDKEQDVEYLTKYAELISVVSIWDNESKAEASMKDFLANFQILNDAVVVYSREELDFIYKVRALLLKAFSLDLYMRGHITVGKMIKFDNNILYGKGLLDALKNEKDNANKLRVTVSQEAKERLDKANVEILATEDDKTIFDYYQFIGHEEYFKVYEPELCDVQCKEKYINGKIDKINKNIELVRLDENIPNEEKNKIVEKLKYIIEKLKCVIKK
jgi:hypothetical protein